MNKFFLRASLPFLLCIFLFLFALTPHPLVSAPSPVTADAADVPTAGDYACILSDDVYFCASPDENRGLFLLPKTYYVRLIEYGTEYCRIEYARNESSSSRLVGYAKTDKLTFVSYTPVRPYLYYLFDVTYVIENSQPNDSLLTQITITCTYYGDYPVGSKTYCYVLRGEEFGYIPKPDGISYEENDEYADYLATLTPPNSEDPASTSEGLSPVQIAILIAVCLLVPILAALILKPPHRPPYETEE